MPSSRRGATILDVARVAGVSRQTVTRALNGMPEVSTATRDRVVQAARTLHYRPNRAAQGLVRGAQVAVGLAVDDLRNPYFPELASALTRRAAERGWAVMLCDAGGRMASGSATGGRHSEGGTDGGGVEGGAAADRAWVDRLGSVLSRVDAIVGHLPADVLTGPLATIPRVHLDEPSAPATDAQIRIDYATGIATALDHLIDRGRQRIAMVDAAAEPTARRRHYRDHLQQRGLTWRQEEHVTVTDAHHGGVAAAARLLQHRPRPDAVLAFNDVIALGLIKGLTRLGVAVPADVAVIGIDGLEVGELITPELTTLSLDEDELARHAVELLDDVLAGRPGSTRVLGHTLVLRESA